MQTPYTETSDNSGAIQSCFPHPHHGGAVIRPNRHIYLPAVVTSYLDSSVFHRRTSVLHATQVGAMGLFEDLRNLSEQIKKRQAHVKGEEATKQALVLPFLQVLGFDVYDPTEVRPEYVADFAKKKSSGQMEKIDYAITLKGDPAVFVECKAIDVAVEDHDGQLARYFNSTPSVKLAVITNGIQYRFFTDLRAPNLMDAAPFLDLNILRITEREAELLKPFTKEQFNPAIVQRHAEEVISLERVTALIHDLLRSPSENFVRFILGELDLVGGRVTANVVGRFEPIVKKSIQTALLGMMTKSIQQEIAPPAGSATAPLSPAPASANRAPMEKTAESITTDAVAKAVPAANPSPAVVSEPDGTTAAGAETTEEEKEIFQAVKRICAGSTNRAAIKYRDGVNFLAINLGPTRSWFLRLFAGSRRKSFVARLPVAQVEPIAGGLSFEAIPDQLDKTRVYFNSIADVDKLRPLILKLYDEAVRRMQSGSADDDGSE